MNILYITNVPSPYRIEYFNILSEYCSLTVVYEKKRSSERDINWVADASGDYNTFFLNGISTGADSALSFEVIKYLQKDFDIIVICGISSPTEFIAIEYCKLHKIPFFFESDGGIAGSGKGIKEKVKRHLLTNAAGYFSTCSRHDQYYLTYGACSDKIYRYPFSSISTHDLLPGILPQEHKMKLRAKLGIRGEYIVLSIGQFIYRKGFDILIKAASKLPYFTFYIIGGEPTNEYLDLVESLRITNVHFESFKSKNDILQYYDAADLFVLPTREDIWGLVVNEAMARALPVITTDNCNAGLEMVNDSKNGFIIPVNDPEALAIAIQNCFNMDRCSMGEAALKTAEQYTIEKMVLRHMEVFNTIVR